ncbi:S8 family peptidase [Streptomyces sp. NBC_01619]|uniref:S8 family peptidase n=1 Tax=Streptomyces pratisoli TaxID=3139917 RepID=A0ACC6QGC8_9ACTN|nr:S8 family peptidase [Streptomyces sp. NBC_01619]MCX4509036.1 S8 family peptidase [Streptomyces sp. NBC_01619]
MIIIDPMGVSMRLFARCAAAALLLAVSVAAPGAAAESGTDGPTPAPLHRSAEPVKGRYIVSLKTGAEPAAVAREAGVKPRYTYNRAMHGFSATLNPTQLEAMRLMPGVAAVEEDARVSAHDVQDDLRSPDGRPGVQDDDLRSRRVVPAASWGLDRADQRALPLDGQYTTVGKGKGATIYIVDTGIDYAHSEFGGRAVFGFDAIGDGRQGRDCEGHGTHVAGTAAGATYGVAPEATLVSVRVLNCEGEGAWSGIIAGLDWVAKNARQPAVLNASLGGSTSVAANDAANTVFASGVLPVIAAGNSAEDACDISPASASDVMTVGATDSADSETDYSNYGECLALYAPGSDIVSALMGGGTTTKNGTSMAAPHVAGVAALYKAAHPTAGARAVSDWIIAQSTKSAVRNISRGSPNQLLFTGGL